MRGGSPAATTRCASATLRSSSDRMSAGSVELPLQRSLRAVQAGCAQSGRQTGLDWPAHAWGWVCPDTCSANEYTTIAINGITWAYHEVRHATIGSFRWVKGWYAGPSPPQLFGLGPVPVSVGYV